MKTVLRQRNFQRRFAVSAGIALVLALFFMLGLSGISLAVHDLGLFELDRNALDPGGAPLPDDWATLYGGGGNANSFTGVLSDTGADGGTQFQGGGSKDDLDITQWLWKAGEPLDKDDITNAYAAAYVNTVDTGDNNVGDLILYYGLDRFSANGSAQVGFWFLQDPNFGLSNVAAGGGFKFNGVHFNNDILVQSNFSQGGVIDRITVYKWQNGALVVVYEAADCLGPPASPADDAACGTVNRNPETSPWPYTPKANEGSPGTFLTGGFFEGGINISRLIPDVGCFTGFLAETRTSTPFDARLKDFVTGRFNLCKIDVDKTGDTLSKVGDAVNYTITLTNTGALLLYKDDITDTLLGNITLNAVDQANPFITSNGCGASLVPGASCTILATRTVQAGDPDPLPNTVTVVYRGKSDLSGSGVTDSDSHSVNLFQPSLAFDKTGDPLSKVGDAVNYTITLTNTSSSDSPNLACRITDALLGTDKTVHLAPGGTDVTTASYTVQAGDADPLPNTANVRCTVHGFPNVLTGSDSHSVNLFQPSIVLTKTGDTLSKVGDVVNYRIEVCNTSSSDSPDLIKDSVGDDKIAGVNAAFGASLSAGVCESHTFTRTVQAGDADPLVNTATAHYHPAGFPNDISASDTHSVNLFQPSLAFDKTGDALSKVGDAVNYTITLTNTSSSDSPNLACRITDALLGTDKTVNLAPGGTDVTTASYTVQAGDADPLPNTANVRCTVDGFGNVLTGSDSHSVNLFQPSIAVSKHADTPISKHGDTVTYTINITNTSSSDSPDLVKDSIVDSLLTLNVPAACNTLAPGASCTIVVARQVQEPPDLDPLLNTVTVHYHPSGFPNDISAQASASVDLVHPGLAVAKSCSPTTAHAGDTINYTCTISNTGDVTLDRVSILDSLKGDLTNAANYTSSTCGASLAAGATCSISYTFVAPAGTSTLVNTVTAVYQVHGLPNRLTASSSCTVTIPSEGCTPGFWKNHESLWDSLSDPIAAAAGFTTGTSFNAFFGLTPAQSGFPDSLTMEGALNLGGGGGEKLARHGVSALLNLAANLDYPLPAGINNATDLYNAIRNAYLTGVFEPLATQLADANNSLCPLN